MEIALSAFKKAARIDGEISTVIADIFIILLIKLMYNELNCISFGVVDFL